MASVKPSLYPLSPRSQSGIVPFQNIPRFPARNEAAADWDRTFRWLFQRLIPKENVAAKSTKDLHPMLQETGKTGKIGKTEETGKTGKTGETGKTGKGDPRQLQDGKSQRILGLGGTRGSAASPLSGIPGWDFPALNNSRTGVWVIPEASFQPLPCSTASEWIFREHCGGSCYVCGARRKKFHSFSSSQRKQEEKPGKTGNSNTVGEFLWKTSGERKPGVQRVPELVFPWKTSQS